MKRLCALVCLVAGLSSPMLLADTRASVNRTSIHADESVRLVIETDARQAPDETAFARDFVITARSTGRSVSYAGGRMRLSTRYEYELSPRREGRIVIPSLRVGNDNTSVLVVDVLSGSTSNGRSPNDSAASSTQDVFIRTTVDSRQPFVQQGVLMTVRFYVGRSMIDAALDQPSIDGASMQQVASDVQTSENLGGRNFQVVTRQYWVVPDRPGRLRIPGARLVGTTAGGFFDEAFGDGLERVNAVADTLVLDVQPQPADAPADWLPLRRLALRYVTVPNSEVGAEKPGRVVIEMLADGAMPADLPSLNLDANNAAQVYPEPAESKFAIRNGRMITTVTRAFSVLPTQAGDIRLTVPPIDWWNTAERRHESAALAPQVLRVSGDATFSADSNKTTAAGKNVDAPRPVLRQVVIGSLMAVVLAALGIVAWIGIKRRSKTPSPTRSGRGHSLPADAPVDQMKPEPLSVALSSGQLPRIAAALCALSEPPTTRLEVIRARLANAQQQEAVNALEAALWGGADVEKALGLLRSAFSTKPEWVKGLPERDDTGLPPLYPTA